MLHIYLLRDGSNPTSNRYKIGHHTGELKKLIDRYITPLPNIHPELFIEAKNAIEMEEDLKKILYNYRETNYNGNISEWVAGIPLEWFKKYISYYARVTHGEIVDNTMIPRYKPANIVDSNADIYNRRFKPDIEQYCLDTYDNDTIYDHFNRVLEHENEDELHYFHKSLLSILSGEYRTRFYVFGNYEPIVNLITKVYEDVNVISNKNDIIDNLYYVKKSVIFIYQEYSRDDAIRDIIFFHEHYRGKEKLPILVFLFGNNTNINIKAYRHDSYAIRLAKNDNDNDKLDNIQHGDLCNYITHIKTLPKGRKNIESTILMECKYISMSNMNKFLSCIIYNSNNNIKEGDMYVELDKYIDTSELWELYNKHYENIPMYKFNMSFISSQYTCRVIEKDGKISYDDGRPMFGRIDPIPQSYIYYRCAGNPMLACKIMFVMMKRDVNWKKLLMD